MYGVYLKETGKLCTFTDLDRGLWIEKPAVFLNKNSAVNWLKRNVCGHFNDAWNANEVLSENEEAQKRVKEHLKQYDIVKVKCDIERVR